MSGVYYTFENEPTLDQIVKTLSICGAEMAERILTRQRSTWVVVYTKNYKCYCEFNKEDQNWRVGISVDIITMGKK